MREWSISQAVRKREKVSGLEGRGGSYKEQYQTHGEEWCKQPRPRSSTNRHVKSREAQPLPSLEVTLYTLDELPTTVVQLR